jgi:cytochrome b561
MTQAEPAYMAGRAAHKLLGWLFAAMAVLHITAALRHHFILKDSVLQRMMLGAEWHMAKIIIEPTV